MTSRKPRERRLWGVFWRGADGRAMWCLLANGRRAHRVGRHYAGQVCSTSWGAFDGGRQYGIDAPTFRAVARVDADYSAHEAATF